MNPGPQPPRPHGCLHRRGFLATTAWLSPLSTALALQHARAGDRGRPAQSLILLWLGGAPSQLETFDPHPDSPIAHGTTAIPSAAPGIQLASHLPQTAEIMDEVALVRSVVGQEGDHQRAAYLMKSGYRMNPAFIHPTIGAILCHECPHPGVEIPAHVSILPGRQPGRGGYLGAQYDAFQIGDPSGPLPDMESPVSTKRDQRRSEHLAVAESSFARGRLPDLDARRTQHRHLFRAARRMMSSDQLKAFEIAEEPSSLHSAYGHTPFGRGCLAARRLVEVGVRCVEVTLNGWDSHVNNHEIQAQQCAVLDPALATLIRDLRERNLLDSTLVMCGGEFGRTPKLNALEGRDHWPHGFSVALAGGGLNRGMAVGETDPKGESREPARPVSVADLHYTIQSAFGIDPDVELMTTAQRPLALSSGTLIRELVRG